MEKKFQPGEEIGAIELVAFEVVHEITFNLVPWLSVSRALRKLILICLCSCDLLNLQGTYSWPNWRIHPSWAGLRNRAAGFQLSLEGKDCRTTFNGTSSGSYSMKLLAGMSCNKVLWISVEHELVFSYDRSIEQRSRTQSLEWRVQTVNNFEQTSSDLFSMI
jgi:hypothetical protein